MKVIYHIKGKPEENAKHVINFFGVLGCIKVNALDKDASKEQKSKFNVVKYYFDYPYFSRIVNPELFQKELNDGEKKFTRGVISLCLCSTILSIASVALLYLAYQNQKSKKMLMGLAFTSIVLLILATVCFTVLCLWVFFDFIKERFIVHRIESLLENEANLEWIRRYKKELICEDPIINAEDCNQKPEKSKDIENIIEFLLERKKIVALYNFLTNGEKLVQAGMAMVNMLLVDGVHPNDIVLDTNSLGGGVAAEVLRRFEKQGVHLTLIHSNSYSSLKDATHNFPHGVGDFFTRWLLAKFLNFWFRRGKLEFNSREVIENTKCPVLIVGRKGDTVIPEEAQLVDKLSDQDTDKAFRRNIVLEHNPTIACENRNIHTDHKGHLVYREDNDSTIKYTSCEAIGNEFINDAYRYLIDRGFNRNFKQENYKKSKFSQNLTKIELKPINEKYIQV